MMEAATMSDPKDVIQRRFDNAGLASDRFMTVDDGKKQSTDHDTRYDDPAAVPGKNYGVYADRTDQFFILDVDKHREDAEDVSSISLAALDGLPDTLEIRSPHVSSDGRGGHRLYQLSGDQTPADLFNERFGTMNPVPTWGEIIAKNKYCVGAGSQLHGCNKDWCDACDDGDGGRYVIQQDRAVAAVDPETVIDALATDPELTDAASQTENQSLSDIDSSSSSPSTSSNSSSSSRTDPDDYDELSETDVTEMLDAIPGDQHFDDWIATAYAVYDWDDGQRGKQLFEKWSQSNPKWEPDESQRQIDYIWSNGESGDSQNNASVGTLIHTAQQHGWQGSASAVSSTSEADESQSDTAQWADEYDITARDCVNDDMTVAAPGVNLEWIELTNGRCGWGWRREKETDDGVRIYHDIVINADIELLSRLEFPADDDRHTEWELRINPTRQGAPSRTIQVTPAAFNNSRTFREEVIGGVESAVFDTHGAGARATNELKLLINEQTAPRRKAHEKIEVVHDDDSAQLITPNGTITRDGWASEPDHVFRGAVSGVKASWQPDPDAIESTDDDLVQSVCEMLPRIRDTDHEQWLAWMGYAFASTYRSTLFNQPASNIDSWNILHVSGKTGAGKSALAKVLNGALGMDMKSTTSAEKTPHAQLEMFCATDGAPIMMDEYNPTNWRQYVTDAFHEHLKKSTDSQTVEKGNADKSVTQYKLESSPVVIGEQQLPEDMAALPRRAVEISLSTQGVKAGSQTASLFQELRSLRDDNYQSGVYHHALSWWRHVVDDVSDPDELVTEWHETMEWIRDGLDDRGVELNSALEREMHQQGLQTVVFGLQRWRFFATKEGADPAVLFDDADILDVCQYLIERKTGGEAHSLNNEDALIELFADAASIIDGSAGEFASPSQKYVEHGTHYTVANQHHSEPTELRIHLKSALPELSRFVRDYGIDHNLYQRSDYYRWFKTSAGDPDSKVIDESIGTHLGDSQRRCVAIDIQQLTDDLDVHRTDVIPPWERIPARSDSSDDDGGSGDGDGDGDSRNDESTADGDSDSGVNSRRQPAVSDIGDIEPSQPMASTTAAIEFGEYDHTAAGSSADGPAIKATLVGDDGTDAKLIAWDEEHLELPIDETGALECDEVTVRGVEPGEYQGTLQLKATEYTTISEGVPDGQESIQSVGSNSESQSGVSDSKASDPAGEQPSEATTDGGSNELPADDQADSDSADELAGADTDGTDQPDNTDTDHPDPDIDIRDSNVPEDEAKRRGKLKGKIRSHDGQPTVDELSQRLGWPADTTENVVQGLLDDGRIMGTSDDTYRVIDG